jgi:uncharacterized SAM-binding protein YcdF (DUF218 family)
MSLSKLLPSVLIGSCAPPKMQKIMALVGIFAMLFGGISILLLHYSKTWLFTEVRLPHAEWIIVLGGESGQRVIGAAELFHKGLAPRILVSGDGDCTLIASRLEMAGVPSEAITLECESRNTYENAQYARQTLTASHPNRIMLVTSWTHSNRALCLFRRAWPEVEWGIHSVYSGDSLRNTLAIYEAGAVIKEYLSNTLLSCW